MNIYIFAYGNFTVETDTLPPVFTCTQNITINISILILFFLLFSDLLLTNFLAGFRRKPANHACFMKIRSIG